MSKRKGAVPGDSGADAAASPSGKSDKSDVNIIPADRLARARAKKYGYPYDPARDAWTKSYVKWKKENHRAQIARERTRDKRAHRAASPGSATAARKKVTPPETRDVKKPVKLRIVGRDGYTVADFYRDVKGAGFSLPGGSLLTLRSKQRKRRRRSNPLANQVPNRSRTLPSPERRCLYAAHSADSASAC